MKNCIVLPKGWEKPKFAFGQRVAFQRYSLWDGQTIEEFGTIIGMEHQPSSVHSECKDGWHFWIELDEDSPGFDPTSPACEHEDELTACPTSLKEVG